MTYDPNITFRNQRILYDFDTASLVQQPILAVRVEKDGRSYFVVQPTCRWLSPGSWIQRLIFITQRIFGVISTNSKQIKDLNEATRRDILKEEYQKFVGTWNPTALDAKAVNDLRAERDAAQDINKTFRDQVAKLIKENAALNDCKDSCH